MDPIDRQAAIDAIDKCSVWVMYTQGDSQKDEAEFVENIIKQTKRAIQSMLREDLPSAQPELSDEEKRLIKQLRSYHNGSYAKVIDKLIASAQPMRKKSRWVQMSDADGIYWTCNECGEDIPRIAHFDPQFDLFPRMKSIDKTNFCPNCGADMREGDHEID